MLAAWDRLVDAAPGSDVSQLSPWALFRKGYGYQPLYLFVLDGDTLLGGSQILHRRVPAVGELGYVPYGPVTAGPDHLRTEALDAVTGALAELARHRFRMLFVQPPRGAHEVSDRLTAHGFRDSSAGLAPAGSIHIDLDRGEDELRMAISKSTRRWLRKWPEMGVEVRVGGHDDIPLLARMLADSAAYRGFDALTEPYLRRLYGALADTERAVLLVGEVRGRPVAGSILTVCGATARARIHGMHRSEENRKFWVPAAIEWESIRWAKRNGCRWYDVGGLGELPLRTLVDGASGDRGSWDGADCFKLQFGGTAYRYPTPVEMIRPWPLRSAYDLSRRFPGGHSVVQRAAQRFRGGRNAATS
jgi:lipid II:glycine glycyltransferase (peptidoglycan interpeptide bridge formation enzyme)